MAEIGQVISREVGTLFNLSMIIQVGLPITTFASMAGLVGQIAWEEKVGNSLVVREPAGVVGAIAPVELPAAPDRRQDRAGACGGVHGRAQAERGRAT